MDFFVGAGVDNLGLFSGDGVIDTLACFADDGVDSFPFFPEDGVDTFVVFPAAGVDDLGLFSGTLDSLSSFSLLSSATCVFLGTIFFKANVFLGGTRVATTGLSTKFSSGPESLDDLLRGVVTSSGCIVPAFLFEWR